MSTTGQAISEPRRVTVSVTAAGEFLDALHRAYTAAQGDSNDEEIEALWDLAAAACGILDLHVKDGGK